MKKPGCAARRRRAAFALPGIETDVVVIAACGDERRLAAIALLQLEAEYACVEGERPVEIGAGHRDVVESSRPCGRDRRHSEARRDEVAGENVI